MVKAFILVETKLGEEGAFLEYANALSDVKKAYDTSLAPYQSVVDLEAENISELKDTISWRIRRSEYFASSLTLVCLDENDENKSFKRD